MATGAAAVFLVFVLGLGLTVLLYLVIRSETRNPPRMDREEAERRAREEGRRYNRRQSGDADTDVGERRSDDARNRR